MLVARQMIWYPTMHDMLVRTFFEQELHIVMALDEGFIHKLRF